MAKLTKAQRKAHDKAEARLRKDHLNDEDREFVLDHWQPAHSHEIGAAGAFFTPSSLAQDFRLDGAYSGGGLLTCVQALGC